MLSLYNCYVFNFAKKVKRAKFKTAKITTFHYCKCTMYLSELIQSRYICSHCRPAIVAVDDIMFRKPVEVGSLLFLSSQVTENILLLGYPTLNYDQNMNLLKCTLKYIGDSKRFT
jgi:hypothetical protein